MSNATSNSCCSGKSCSEKSRSEKSHFGKISSEQTSSAGVSACSDDKNSQDRCATGQHSVAVAARKLEKTVGTGDNRLTILSGLDLEIKSGESLAIVGTSGSGKSTLLGLLAGLDLPTAGQVTLAGQSLEGLDEDERARIRGEHTGFVFQSFQLLGNLSALENVMLPLELAGVDNPDERAEVLLNRVGLQQRLQHYPRQLSGGEQQRVAIARAFAGEPRILFADEPTGNLDEQTGEKIIELLFEVNRERAVSGKTVSGKTVSGKTVSGKKAFSQGHGQPTTLVLVTHDMSLARRCQRVLKLQGGVLEEVS